MDKALELCFTGDVINATEAERIRLVTKIVSHAELMPSARDLAQKIAEGPAIAIELTRKGLYAAMDRDYFAQLDYESYAQNKCFQTADFHEAVSAFQKKRKPRFQGR
jgi:enoyl-CoA hydratase/carnithine racemase